ncbi:M61 family metallopeptidase [Thiohalomonas denitrificans]|uniref:Predicted metalloprotease, contains C-terminal PDZ domain n=1 Tax=Thiohalomonas denitrificans TaxID=415747 RepID=A0A1G5QC34_9GAMM|nr:PDZ domain-containing protein [Thiohalomonas denitrificans]SCZ59423.1 Predicted metalloprotease, contains C-terminal PDZ domain [Thiohalomonas denitrificans]
MAHSAIHYTIRPAHPEAHLFEITLRIDEPASEGQTLSMAAWIPGSYMIRDFAKNVVRLSASSDGEPVAVEKLDKQTWQCAPCEGSLEVHYEVYCWDLSVRGAHLDPTHGYFNGTGVFLKADGHHHTPCSVDIRPPEDEAYGRWRVATTLPADGAAPYRFGRYRADSYAELVDNPVEMGKFDLIEFESRGKPHAMALTGRYRADTARLATDLQKICDYHIGLFGELPAERYLFLTMAVGDGYGGLEHRSCSSLMCKRDALPRHGMVEPDDAYRDFLGLCSHEYFHTWNVKRIRPKVFQEYDLSREVHTRLLWAFEGITSYYDELALVRAGLISPESYLELLGQMITRVMRVPGRHKQTVAESSFDAWTKLYKQDENAPNAIVSYYSKGALVALALDLTIRRETHGKRSLDDVMHALWNEYGRNDRGIDEREYEAFVEEVAGISLSGFFDKALRGTDDLPLAELLSSVGVGYHLRSAESDTDKGGKPPSPDASHPDLGIRLAPSTEEAKILFAFEGRSAMRAGLSAGDVVVAIDGIKTTRGNLDQLLSRYQGGDKLDVHAFRRDELMTFEVELQETPPDTCYLTLDDAEGETLQYRQHWLGGAG